MTWPSNSETLSYNPSGNLSASTLNGTTTFSASYSIANRLASVTSVATPASFTYDAYGERLNKTDTGTGASTNYAYDLQGHLLEENAGGVVKDYIYTDDKLVGIFLPATSALYYVAGDWLGSPIIITDSGQNVVWSTQYQPYGATAPTGTLTNNIRLPGQYADSETGLSYNGFRDYMPGTGRYIEADPIGLEGGLNSYAYASGNPGRFTDRFGLASEFMGVPLLPIQASPESFEYPGLYQASTFGFPILSLPPEQGPGTVVSVSACVGVCLGFSWNDAGYGYFDFGLGSPGIGGTIKQVSNMYEYCNGSTTQGGYLLSFGGNSHSNGVGFQWPPFGVSTTFGVPPSEFSAPVPKAGRPQWYRPASN